MASFKMGGIWWYKFYFAGQEIRESSKSTSKTVAKAAEPSADMSSRAESGAGDETIMEIAGHVDRQMLRHYSHIRMKAKTRGT
jgi:hypothetical protein